MREKIAGYEIISDDWQGGHYLGIQEDDDYAEWCGIEEVRQLESDYAKLEAQLGEAVEKIKHIRDFSMTSTAVRPSMIFNMCNNFLTTLDQEKEKSL